MQAFEVDPFGQKHRFAKTSRGRDQRQPRALTQSLVQSLQQARARHARVAEGWNVQLGRQKLIEHGFTYTEAASLYR